VKNASDAAQGLSADRAFVVQFRAGSETAGRVEHVTSSSATHFESLEELLAFVKRALHALTPPPPADPA
jgi:hypothetical protein